MDAWIETAAGNIAMAAAVSHIVLRESKGGSAWEVAISVTGGATSTFATGITDQAAAKRVRNRLAVTLSKAKSAEEPQLVTYRPGAGEVVHEDFEL